ncbi:16S rRNA (adenine(1518)-N(6)/adenine(1519)-N(6))-dimethyltransferase [Sphingorhabdus lutea]|uniref:Ribosomal RNA small subunit methyltransferase A n=1 Tax=Sphingorhabdus lutea TaxID=1913578 RepID=A0A1L3JCK2_9SPHN|nr:16S rRNA (adenine(1518)-N(6)/adenine(1519)-N(6))-dimethyltransferase RsmA [Sphingorhabdus lutea]APG62858.1 16S rRNA (adenine(1518)-N(6)/adenine(1519)-N(6))-dimethyltransferase [Sphingorhabdus lutea]
MSLPPLREVIAQHNLRANKALGQNFLLDEQLLDRIAAVIGDLSGKNVYEVGPGPGGLTRALLRAGANVIAVEKDKRCLPALQEISQYFDGRLKIIEEDALKIDPATLFDGPFHIASNLPYNIGSALAVNWLSGQNWPPKWQSLTLMFQREVADRIVAPHGSKEYGRLSILAQWRAEAKIAMPVHRSAFTPPPKIMSAIVHITPKNAPDGVNPYKLEEITAAAFGQRRKMLRQSLKSVAGALDAMEAAGIPSDRRAETISVQEFTKLAKILSK